jgi:hypothetical protein
MNPLISDLAVTPASAPLGELVTIVITTKKGNLSSVDEVESDLFNILEITSPRPKDGKKLTLKAVRVPETATVGKHSITLKDKEDKTVGVADFEVKPNEWTKMEKAAYLIQKQLGVEFNVSVGYNGFVGKELAEAPRTSQSAFQNRQHGGLSLKLDTAVFGDTENHAFLDGKGFEWRLNANGNLGMQFDSTTKLGGFGVGTSLAYNIDWIVYPEAFVQFQYDKASFENASEWALYGRQYHQGGYLTMDPSEMLFGGHSKALVYGLAGNSNFKTGKLPWNLRLSVEHQRDWFYWNDETQVNGFNGEDEAVNLKASAALAFSEYGPGAPDAILRGSFMPWGVHGQPVWGPGPNNTTFHKMNGGGLELVAAWNGVEDWQPYILGGHSVVSMDNWDNGKMSEWHFGGGSTIPAIYTHIDATLGWRTNITPMGEDSPFFLITTLRPDTPRDIWGGRLDAFSLSFTYDQFRDSQGAGYNALGAFLGVELGTLIFGQAPDKPKVKVDEGKPAEEPAAEAAGEVNTEDTTLEAIADINL